MAAGRESESVERGKKIEIFCFEKSFSLELNILLGLRTSFINKSKDIIEIKSLKFTRMTFKLMSLYCVRKFRFKRRNEIILRKVTANVG